jgi:UrcA family protein
MSNTVKSAGSAAFAFAITFGLIAMTVEQPAAASTVSGETMSGQARSERVSLAGIDLSKAEDVRQLQTRVRAASRRVCAPLAERRLTMASEYDCRRSARAAAEVKVAGLMERSRAFAATQPSVMGATLAVVAPGNN